MANKIAAFVQLVVMGRRQNIPERQNSQRLLITAWLLAVAPIDAERFVVMETN